MPAERNTVVGVRRAASGVLVDMMDFAPARRDVATRDDAPAVAEPDRELLMVVEDPIG